MINQNGAPRRSAERAAEMAHRFERPMFAVALLVIPAIILTSVDVAEPWATIGRALNWFTWAAFAFELVVMLTVVPSRSRWLTANPVDVVIVFLTVPALTSIFTSLRALRLLRLLRVLRLKPVVRWMFSAGGLKYAALFALLVAVSAGYAYSSLTTGHTAWEGFYWAITTMTTVGYGDLPVTGFETQALAIVVMTVGIGFVAVLTGALAERFLAGRIEQVATAERAAMETDIELLAQVEGLSQQVASLREALRLRVEKGG